MGFVTRPGQQVLQASVQMEFEKDSWCDINADCAQCTSLQRELHTMRKLSTQTLSIGCFNTRAAPEGGQLILRCWRCRKMLVAMLL